MSSEWHIWRDGHHGIFRYKFTNCMLVEYSHQLPFSLLHLHVFPNNNVQETAIVMLVYEPPLDHLNPPSMPPYPHSLILPSAPHPRPIRTPIYRKNLIHVSG